MDDSSTEIPKLTDTGSSSELSGKIMLFSVVTLMAIIIFILSFHFYARLISRHLRDHSAATNDNRRLRHVDINTLYHRGLSPSLIKLIPTFLYSSPSSAMTPDCAVCLSEFEEGETGRVLPGCCHSFHVECIDAWFRSHSSCPLCRAPVKPKARDCDSGEVFVPVGYGVVVESSSPGTSVECGCSSAAVVLMVPVECRRKSVDFVVEPAALWVAPVTTASSLPV